MSQLERLQEALELMKEAEEIVEELMEDEQDSLNEYYGCSLQIIKQELNKFSDNSNCYMGRNSNLEDIMESHGENWTETDND